MSGKKNRRSFGRKFHRMNYTELQQNLRNSYSFDMNFMPMKLEYVTLQSCTFNSAMQINVGNPQEENKAIFYGTEGVSDKNLNFTYPVFIPDSENAKDEAIVLLHGLNERSWNKYLSWGYTLAKNTGKSVILFPIAFHMNRSPESWASPRHMNPYVFDRQQLLPDTKNLTFANVALSERLTSQPQRFFLSGYQTANDLLQLVDSIQEGDHPWMNKGATIHFFGYSISVLLLQVLLIANPEGRFNHSKFLFFCGGSVVESMHGISKYILDSKAFYRLTDFYGEEIYSRANKPGFFNELLYRTSFGEAFNAMTTHKRLKKYKRNLFRKFRDQVLTISLNRDKIIPADEIEQTMRGSLIERWDFNYNYSHEIPFPYGKKRFEEIIDHTFDSLFYRISLFLA